MSPFRLLLAAVAVLGLAACAPTAKSDISAPPASAPLDAAAPAPPPGAEVGADIGGTDPYGSAGGAPTGNAGAGAEDATISGPDGTIWLKPGAARDAYRNDADNCYGYARAQTENDARIESDSGAALRDSTGGIGVVELQQRMNQYARGNRMQRLFGQCMEAKGYSRS